MDYQKPKKEPSKPKRKKYDPEILPVKAKAVANLNRTLRGIRKA